MRHSLQIQNIYLRQRGKEHARRHFGALFAMVLVVSGVTLGLEELLTFLGDRLMATESAAFAAAATQYVSAETIGNTQALQDALFALILSPKFLLFNLVYIIATALLSNGLSLGHINQCLTIGKGGQVRVLGVFSRMHQCLKALRLTLWMALKAFLWELPGIGVMLLALVMTAFIDETAGGLLLFGGFVLIFVLMIPAVMRYSLSMYVLADNPDWGVRDCVDQSKFLTQGHKWQYFKLGLPCLFSMLGLFLAVCVIGGMVLGLLGLENSALGLNIVTYLSILVMMLLMPRLNMTYALFYLLRSDMARNASKPKTGPNGMPLTAVPTAEPALEQDA